jgi:hypothetical protein
MKKNFSLTTIAVLISGCTILRQPTETDLWALSKAEKYSKVAHISYLKCSYQWPDTECLQNNWDTYGSPEIEKTSQEEWKQKALAFIKTMETLGAAHVLQDKKYQCSKIINLDTMIFTKGKRAICDSGIEYKIMLKDNNWHIDVLKTPKNEAKANGIKE